MRGLADGNENIKIVLRRILEELLRDQVRTIYATYVWDAAGPRADLWSYIGVV